MNLFFCRYILPFSLCPPMQSKKGLIAGCINNLLRKKRKKEGKTEQKKKVIVMYYTQVLKGGQETMSI